MSDLSDWDAIKTTAQAAPAQAASSNTADWDAIPSRSGSGMSDAEYAQHVKDTPDAMRVNVRGLPGDSSSSDQIPTTPGNTYGSEMAARQAKFQADVAAGREQAPTDRTWADRMIGGGEAALSTVTGLTTGAVGMLAGGVAGAVGNITGGRYGMKDGVEEGMRQGQESLTYQPRTDAGQEYAGNVGDVMANALPAMPLTAEMSAMGRGAGLAARQLRTVPLNDITRELPAPERIEPTMQKPLYKMTDGRPVRVDTPVAPISELQSVGAAVNQDPGGAPSILASDAAHETAQSNGSDVKVDTASRKQVLQDIGIKTARQSALDANGKNAASDYHVGKYDEPAGVIAKNQFADERNALQAHAESLVSDTNSTGGLDQDGRITAGRPVLEALDGLKQWFGDGWRSLYARADAQAAGVPIDMPSTHKFIGGDKADFLGTVEGESLLKGINARMKSLGMIDEAGNAQGVTVKQAEQLKQYLGDQWQPRTSRLIRGMKNAIDDDVVRTGGENGDIYRDARNMRRMQAETIDSPDGIAKIMDSSGPDGINRKVPIEDVTRTIANLPDAQFMHIIKTLGALPDGLQGLGKAAIAEIKGHFANKLLDAGSNTTSGKPREIWGNTAVNTFIDNNSSRIQSLFNTDELQKISTLRDAGNILSVDTAYPGASAQAANAMKRGMMSKYVSNAAMSSGAGIGGIFGAPGIGAQVGRAIGDKAASSMGEGSAAKNFQKGMVNLSEFPK